MTFPSTERVDQVLRYIAGYLEAHDGIGPSFQNISDALRIRSKSHVWRIVDELERAGLIARLGNRARSLRVLTDIAIPRAPDGAPLYFVRVEA